MAISVTTGEVTNILNYKVTLHGEYEVYGDTTILHLMFIVGEPNINWGSNQDEIEPRVTPFEYTTYPWTYLRPNTYYEYKAWLQAFPHGSAPYQSYLGEVRNFTTSHLIVTTQAVTNILTTSVTANGTITDKCMSMERGFEYYKDGTPETLLYKYTTNGQEGAYSKSITGLLADTKYHIRTYVRLKYWDRTEEKYVYYVTTGDWVEFTTESLKPVVTTQATTEITNISATGNGNITNIGGTNCTKRGICWNTTGTPTISDSKSEETGDFGVGAFTRLITGLQENQLYYVRAYAYNSAGYGYGNQIEFTTLGPPVVTIQEVTDIAIRTATANATIISGDEISERGFELGLSESVERKVSECGTDLGIGAFSLPLTKL